MEQLQHCPICQHEVRYYQRHPKYICKTCTEELTDSEGRPIRFHNTSIFGHGCEGSYRDTGERYEGDTCYVQGVVCKAEEFRFGGIVVQVV